MVRVQVGGGVAEILFDNRTGRLWCWWNDAWWWMHLPAIGPAFTMGVLVWMPDDGSWVQGP